MIIKQDIYLVSEIPFIEPKFGARPEKGIPYCIALCTTREEAYTIACRCLEYNNFKHMYSQIFISYYNGEYGKYWGDLYLNNNLDNIASLLGCDVVQDSSFVDNCPLYFHNPISCSLNIINNIKDFRTMCNWVKTGIKNWFAKQ
jgi:hypothetical protein